MLTEDSRRSALLAPKSRPFGVERPVSESDFMSIGDVSRLYGLSLRALRFYEERGLLQPLRRGVTRLYDANTRARLELILKGKQLGFTLTEIRRMVQETEDNSASPGLALAPGQVLDQIALLERQRRDLDVAIEELRATHAKMQGADQAAPQEAAVA